MERIDQEEGARRLDAFRQQRLQGDYIFEFELEHKPRKARTVRYDGIMWGSWNEQGAVTRFKIFPNDADREADGEGADALVELLVQNGPQPSAWMRRDPAEPMQRVEGEALFEPLLPELVYSVFDLQMPFIYWEDFIYEGPSLIGMSSVQSKFAVESFKKVQEQYIVKKITLAEYPSKDRTTFDVEDASVGLKLDKELFEVPAEPTAKPAVPACCGGH